MICALAVNQLPLGLPQKKSFMLTQMGTQCYLNESSQTPQPIRASSEILRAFFKFLRIFSFYSLNVNRFLSKYLSTSRLNVHSTPWIYCGVSIVCSSVEFDLGYFRHLDSHWSAVFVLKCFSALLLYGILHSDNFEICSAWYYEFWYAAHYVYIHRNSCVDTTSTALLYFPLHPVLWPLWSK